jgi:glycosyltransferase involved in cell wall biosynthesis
MRILMINHEFTITGASTIFFQLAQHLRGRGHEIAILPCIPADGPMAARYHAAEIPILSGGPSPGFDLAIANTIAAGGYVQHLGGELPVIWFIHEAEVGLRVLMEHPTWIGAFARAAAVIYNMPFQNDVFRSFTYALPEWKFHTIPIGVEVDPASIVAAPAKARPWRIVQVGTLEPRKRPGDLIRAVALTGLDAECIFCGRLFEIDPAARSVIEQNPDRFRIIEGASDGEVLGWQQSADIATLVSGSETQGLAAYQAALLGRPLILSDLLCYRGIFRHGESALMFPAGAVDMLAISIAMLAANPSLGRRLGAAAREAAARFTRDGFFAQVDAVLQSAVSRRSEAER